MSYPRIGRAPCTRSPKLLSLAIFSSIAFNSFPAHADILLGSGDDQYSLDGNNAITRSDYTVISGGSGNDSLSLYNARLQNPARLQHWETLRLLDSTQLEFTSDLTLGGSDILPGRLEISSSSALLLPHFSASILSSGGQYLSVSNLGTIDMRGTTANRLLIDGDYEGNGSIYMDMVAGDDNSLSDRLIINSGHASGGTELVFRRLGGSGAPTEDGILVVETRDGATTSNNAFYMRDSISAGPYEYLLFRGSDDPEESDNWYLRSTINPGEQAATEPSGTNGISTLEIRTTDNGDATAEATVAPRPETPPIHLYRPEIPLYAQAKSLARITSLQEIGSYHKRRGEQRSWFDGANDDWMRVYHQSADQNWRGDVNNRFDGDITGVQIGTNIWAGPTCTGGAREMGLFFGSSQARGDVTGFARGFDNYSSGRNELSTLYAGYYFNDYKQDQSYFDFTAKVTYLKLQSQSFRAIGDTIYGPQLTAALEKGITLHAGDRFNLEPQAQVVVNYSNLSAFNDGISWVEPDMTPEANFRLGLRAYNVDSDIAGLNLRAYVYGNVWHTLGGNDQLQFDLKLQLDMEREATWSEFGGGIVLLDHRLGSAFLNVGYQRSLDALNWSGGSANLGFNWNW
ncbi:autotransporter outer membrane beta-barrel domain-containing protein [Microbulbifer aggregans]|uniref:autotransporter family protein n=1 Tax=Microbulbifer aggregans TaxID=1769779 RepID=UPI001CFE3D2E|nr:autotransporter outer membrane beta-barrel domain-containing protein [Microbulbifer aggregans]